MNEPGDGPTLTEQLKDAADAAKRLGVEPHTMLAAIQAVSVTRRGSIEWSQHDLDIAESCLGAWLAAGGPHEVTS